MQFIVSSSPPLLRLRHGRAIASPHTRATAGAARCGRAHRLGGWLVTGMLLASVAPSAAQPVFEPTLYRIFLKTGTPLVTWGEFARVGDRVAFTLALGDPNGPDTLQMVSLPSDVIDWERTNLYTDTVRSRRYAKTRGESDYKALTDEMARALTSIAFSTDSVARLAVAEQARRSLVEWSAQHFGYRAPDVRDLAAAVEETIAGIRADAGERHFSIDLVATVEPPSALLLDAPTTRQSIELAAEVARSTDVPADRMSLQAAILLTLSRNDPSMDADWVTLTRHRLSDDAKMGARVDRQYAGLVSRAARDAGRHAATADVKGVERVLADVRRKDDKLGRRRPADIKALMAALELQVDTARQRRLDLDRWKYRDETYRTYRHGVESSLKLLDDVTKAAEAIRSMSGPNLKGLTAAGHRLVEAGAVAALLSPPDELHASHDTLVSAVQLMQAAVGTRRTAMQTSDLEAARNASAAAAGALLLVGRARDEIDAFFAPPKFR